MQTGAQPHLPGSTAKLRGRIGRGDGFVALRLDGIIDEHNGLADLVAAIGDGQTLLIDLGGVKRLNSVGVRDWVNWLRALRAKWKSIVLFDCPPPVMNEVNFVKNFAEGAVITTFQAPTFCQQCKKEESKTLDALALKAGGATMPSFRCERGDCQNALDDDEESYLGFLASLPPTPDASRLATMTTQAREILKNGATPITPEGGVNAVRGSALATVGIAPQPDLKGGAPSPRPPAVPAAAKPMPPGAAEGGSRGSGDLVMRREPNDERSRGGQIDWVFASAIAAMVAVLGVLVYLLMTLE